MNVNMRDLSVKRAYVGQDMSGGMRTHGESHLVSSSRITIIRYSTRGDDALRSGGLTYATRMDDKLAVQDKRE